MHSPSQKTKYIVVLGGVLSGVGKGVATASIGKILKEYGFLVTAMKIDPYLNLNAGTLRPTEHGEVWVTDDGGEIDQDLGNYERFLGIDIPKKNCITSGQIYKTIIDKEIAGGYLGKTVQFIPHVPDEVKRRVKDAADGFEVCLIEVGGTVGDYENIPFLFAVKSLERELGKENMMYVLVSYLPVPSHVGEMKTKPTQMAVKLLSEQGIFPDFILCRAAKPLDEIRRKKIEQYANIPADHVISAPDVEHTIYSIPLNFEKENLGEKIMNQLKVTPKKKPSWDKWKVLVDILSNPQKKVHIAMIGKYVESGDFVLTDSYISVNESLKHAAAAIGLGVSISWVDAKALEKKEDINQVLEKFDGIVVPGGFGATGVEGKINAIQYAREHKVPYLGLCYGMQLAVVEFARNVCKLAGAHSTEIDKNTQYPVITLLPEQKTVEKMSGTMRLGAYAAVLKEHSQVLNLYTKTGRLEKDKERIILLEQEKMNEHLGRGKQGTRVVERHRHRYELNPDFVKKLEDRGMVFSGYHERQDGTKLMEFIELPGQTFLGTQAHPEFKSRLEDPSPLFVGFLEAAAKQKA